MGVRTEQGDPFGELRTLAKSRRFGTILIDPPWRFTNRTGKVAPEHKRLRRYLTLSLEEIQNIPVPSLAGERCHLYLWVPNALLREGLDVLRSWSFDYKTNIVWYKVRKDGGPDGRGVGFYFRNVTEVVLFGIKGSLRTLKPGRTQTNIIVSTKERHSKKPKQLYEIIEACSPGPYLELFARDTRPGWYQWGNELQESGSRLKLTKKADLRDYLVPAPTAISLGQTEARAALPHPR